MSAVKPQNALALLDEAWRNYRGALEIEAALIGAVPLALAIDVRAASSDAAKRFNEASQLVRATLNSQASKDPQYQQWHLASLRPLGSA